MFKQLVASAIATLAVAAPATAAPRFGDDWQQPYSYDTAGTLTASAFDIQKRLPVRMVAYIYEPPTNIRATPAGEVITVARTPVCVPIHSWIGEWNLISYPVVGWVHDSQLLFGYCP